jgi:O-antigen ligase
VWALLSAALSDQPALALWGTFLTGTGALFLAALVGAWALGAAGGSRGRHLVAGGLVVGALANAAVALLESVFDLESLHLPLVDGRAPGLMGNPVFLGSLLAGAVWLVLDRAATSRWWLIALVGLGAGLELSGTRFALALAMGAIGAWTRRAGWRPTAAAGAALVAGLTLGGGVSTLGGTVSGTARLSDESAASGGVSMRVATWATAPAALREKPIFGHGPGRYGAATAPHRTHRLAVIGPDRYYSDAHNLLIEYAVTTGLVGVALMAALVCLALRRANTATPLGGFAAIVLAGHLLQPQHVALTPLAFLALGAATPVSAVAGGRVVTSVRTALSLAGAAAAAWFLIGAFHLDQARLDFDAADARAALSHVPPWPEPRTLLARIHTFNFVDDRDPAEAQQALAWWRAAVAQDPADPRLWNNLADAQAVNDQLDAAAISYARALRLDPWSVRALNGRGRILQRRGNTTEARRLMRRSLSVLPNQPDIRRALATLSH